MLCCHLHSQMLIIRPLQVVLLFLVPKDHAGGQYISNIATNKNQSDTFGMLSLNHFVHTVYKLLRMLKSEKHVGREPETEV